MVTKLVRTVWKKLLFKAYNTDETDIKYTKWSSQQFPLTILQTSLWCNVTMSACGGIGIPVPYVSC